MTKKGAQPGSSRTRKKTKKYFEAELEDLKAKLAEAYRANALRMPGNNMPTDPSRIGVDTATSVDINRTPSTDMPTDTAIATNIGIRSSRGTVQIVETYSSTVPTNITHPVSSAVGTSGNESLGTNISRRSYASWPHISTSNNSPAPSGDVTSRGISQGGIVTEEGARTSCDIDIVIDPALLAITSTTPARANKPGLIPRPAGKIEINMLCIPKRELQAIQRDCRLYIKMAKLDWKVEARLWEVETLALIYKAAREEHPILCRYEGNWATYTILKQYCQNLRKNMRKAGVLDKWVLKSQSVTTTEGQRVAVDVALMNVDQHRRT
ncbi:hypothetical protein QCA50_018078 [Cerrena zonata]|uniref:Uncharacterized protein n=1 Tax=Cerrena zonata TaxID=2478898 RepID=A0AAW0FBV4_9APHY